MFEISGKGDIEVGQRTSIGKGARIIFSAPGRVRIGDYCTIGEGVKIVVSGGDVEIGDWTTLHDNCLVLCKEGVAIGAHCWFGQNCVIDGTGGIRIGRGVRVGMYSQLWSHVAAGERLEGCTLFAEREVVIGDNVWLVGTCIVASGVTLGDRLVALIGSNITKSFDGGMVIAGVPAAPRPGLSFYRDVELLEKSAMMAEWLAEFLTAHPSGYTLHQGDGWQGISGPDDARIVFAANADTAHRLRAEEPGATVCCLERKDYAKRFTDTEQRVLKFLSGNRARFFSA